MENLLPVLGLVTLGSLLGLVGAIAVLSKKEWAGSLSVHGIPFAAGILLAASLLDVLPEAVEEAGAEVIFPIVLIVMVVAFFFEQFFVHFHHHEEHKRTLKASLPLIVSGDTIHNFIDGAVIAAAYMVEPALGLLVALATFFHETPHELGDFGIMIRAGWNKMKVIWVNVFSAMASYLGAILVLVFSEALEGQLPVFLAVAGGLFLYIAASDLLPEVHEERKDSPWHQAGFLLLGVFVIWLLGQILPHA